MAHHRGGPARLRLPSRGPPARPGPRRDALREPPLVGFDAETTGLDYRARPHRPDRGGARPGRPDRGGGSLRGPRSIRAARSRRPRPASTASTRRPCAARPASPRRAAPSTASPKGRRWRRTTRPSTSSSCTDTGEIGRRFDHPVLLSAAAFGEEAQHTLDAIAAGLGGPLDAAARHTATGDAVATAQVLLRLLPRSRPAARTFGGAVAAMRRHQRMLPGRKVPRRAPSRGP